MAFCPIRYRNHVNVRTFQYTASNSMISAVWIDQNNGAFILALLRERLLNYNFLTTDGVFDGY